MSILKISIFEQRPERLRKFVVGNTFVFDNDSLENRFVELFPRSVSALLVGPVQPLGKQEYQI
ncbi:MAG: hypothetical protein IH918_07675 [Acidobacteria bacterium]|nr:hypothetical protein [Acidobacteriota bacterium]